MLLLIHFSNDSNSARKSNSVLLLCHCILNSNAIKIIRLYVYNKSTQTDSVQVHECGRGTRRRNEKFNTTTKKGMREKRAVCVRDMDRVKERMSEIGIMPMSPIFCLFHSHRASFSVISQLSELFCCCCCFLCSRYFFLIF